MSDTFFDTDPKTKQFRREMAQFFDATTDAIVFLDRNYNFTFANRRANELISEGRPLVGDNLFKRFPAAHYEDSPFVINYRRTMDHGESTEFETFYGEPLNMWLRVQSYPADEGLMIFFRDVTREKLDREELRRKTEEAQRQHAEIESLYRTAPIGLALFDLDDYHYLRLNDRQAAFFGLKPEQIVGRTLTEMAPIEGLRELFDQVRDGKPVINYPLEGTLITDPTDYRYWLVSYFPVYGADGSVQGITAASLEITQQRKAEQALMQSEKLAVVGRLASSIAHEINNPLEAVTNLLYLASCNNDVEAIHEYIRNAEVELRRVAAIATQTLRFHKQTTHPQSIPAEQLIDSVLSIYHGKIVNAGVKLSERSRALKPVTCYDGEIRQVISNLVSNALDAMSGTDRRLFVRTRLGTNWKTGEKGVIITVGDNGSGMSHHTRQKLFNPFFTTKGITGTGLGLWVSKEIVDRHHGTLRVKSSLSPKYHGTVFDLFLPFEAHIEQ